MVKVPWGLVVLAFVGADLASLWLAFDALRPAEGFLTAFVLVVLYAMATAVLGVWTMKWGGLFSLRRVYREGVAGGRVDRAMLNSLLIVIAGLLMLFPGILSDAAGALLLLPPVRALMRRFVKRRVVVWGGAHVPGAGRPRRDAPRQGEDGPLDVDDYRVE